MPDNRERRPFRLGRGLLRLWVVASAFWIAAIGFAFWSGNGGAGARWVWNDTAAERAAVPARQWTPQNFPSVAQGAANIAAGKASGRKSLTWEEFMNEPAPPVIISLQINGFLLVALLPPLLLMLLGGSLFWAVRGFSR